MMRSTSGWAAGLGAVLLLTACAGEPARIIDLSPASWETGELETYIERTNSWGQPIPLATGRTGMIAATSMAAAVRAGHEVLRQGGSAADAALTHALADIVLMAGCCVSHAGFMTMVYYEAATGQVHSMNGAWNTVLAETDPLSIPGADTPSGRSALVPGFMAGVQAAHDRFGKVPWDKLFQPAIYFAEEGFELSATIAGMIAGKKEVLSRLPETKAVFTKADGEWYEAGDLFRQPKLAETLRQVAAQGASYMYRGAWARKLVEAVQAEGGKMTLKDLESYEVIWSEPSRTTFRDYEVFAVGRPNVGGVNIVEALNLVELANLPQYGHYSTAPQALYDLIRIARVSDIMGTSLTARGLPRDLIRRYAGDLDPSLDSRLTKAGAQRVWDRMQQPDWSRLNIEVFDWSPTAAAGGGHSDAVVTVDAEGNVAAVLHTINTGTWGTTGIMVDGVSIADPAASQQTRIAAVGPGQRLPEATNPFIVLKNGRPVLASSSIGMGVHEQSLQSAINVLEYGMNPKAAVDTAQFLRPVAGGSRAARGLSDAAPGSQMIPEGEFASDVLEAAVRLGQPVMVIPQARAGGWRGGWVGILIDLETGALQGAAPRFYNGWAVGH